MSSSSSSGESELVTWINWFCNLPGHEFLCEVDATFIEDTFNLYGLPDEFKHFRDCIEVILGDAPRSDKEGLSHPLYRTIRDVYGLIHARFIVTGRGLSLMLAKLDNMQFGVCPRTLCRGTPTLPVGVVEYLHVESVKLYCPLCEDIYDTPSHTQSPHNVVSKLDGAYFGPSFPHLLLLGRTLAIHNERTTEQYTPRIFGFRVRNQRGRKSLAESMVAESNFDDTITSNNTSLSTNDGNYTNSTTMIVQDSTPSNTAAATVLTTATTTTLSSSSSTTQPVITLASLGLPYPNADGNILDPLIRKIRRGIPLTSPWQDGKRPEADDFNDDDDEVQAVSSKRRKRHNGAGE